MNQRKDTYRAALKREPDAAPRTAKVTQLRTRYIRVTIEFDADLTRDLVRWVESPVSAIARAGAAVLRPLTGNP